jgi:hypothetical protein
LQDAFVIASIEPPSVSRLRGKLQFEFDKGWARRACMINDAAEELGTDYETTMQV